MSRAKVSNVTITRLLAIYILKVLTATVNISSKSDKMDCVAILDLDPKSDLLLDVGKKTRGFSKCLLR